MHSLFDITPGWSSPPLSSSPKVREWGGADGWGDAGGGKVGGTQKLKGCSAPRWGLGCVVEYVEGMVQMGRGELEG